MRSKFDWEFSGDSLPDAPQDVPPWWAWDGIFFWLATAVLLGLLLGGYAYTRQQLQRTTRELIAAAQQTLDLQHGAFLAGDGELFFALQDADSAWLAAELRPESQAQRHAGLRITHAEQHGSVVRARAEWSDAMGTWQRMLFFEWEAGQLRQIATDAAFWGGMRRTQHAWGTLTLHEADAEWGREIAAYVAQRLRELCNGPCARDQQITLAVRDDFTETAVPQRLHIPSPRLLGLDSQGTPGARFWQQLDQRLQAEFAPVAVRFAVPELLVQRFNFGAAARAFMQAHPRVTIELVELEARPDAAQMRDLDGAAFAPTAALLAAGAIHDLTDFASSDTAFDTADFYAQIWPGAQWQGRMWSMPQAAQMRLLFYDRPAFQRAGLPEPSLRWTWDEMGAAATAVVAAQPPGAALQWGYADPRLDTLFAYAYNQQEGCADAPCTQPLAPTDIAAALDWYRQAALADGYLPNVSRMPADERARLLTNWQAIDRRVAIWADDPVYYEHRLLLAPLGAVPFPGSTRFDGVTPLHLESSTISAFSRHPRVVWEWLRWLSYESPSRQFRLVPARPSVAQASQFWQTLPRPLGEAMRAAFPFARAVTAADQQRLTWAQIEQVTTGAQPALEAAHAAVGPRWFAPSGE